MTHVMGYNLSPLRGFLDILLTFKKLSFLKAIMSHVPQAQRRGLQSIAVISIDGSYGEGKS
jgi:hypothetical protein